MHFGFSIIYQAENLIAEGISTSNAQLNYASKNGTGQFSFEYSKNDRFAEDKLFFENTDFIVGLDGVILNRISLEKKHSAPSWKALFLTLYKKHKYQLANSLTGEFSGFIFDKNEESLFYFGNQTGSKRIYYSHNSEGYIIAPSLKEISIFFTNRNNTISLNQHSAYSLLTGGGMLGNSTLMNGVYRLLAGEHVIVNQHNIALNKYLDFNDVNIKQDSKSNIIDRLDHDFKAALKLEYEKDLDSSYPPLATLSGGLDSRMNVVLAHKLGYKVENFCFSQSGYDDEIIAKEIAEHLGQKIDFVPLDGGDYVFDFEENMNTYEGQIFYTTSAHFNYAIKRLDKSLGLIHSGLIGDGLLGTFIHRAEGGPPDIPSKLISKTLYPKIKTPLDQLAKEFVSGDVFNLYQRGFNVAISGCWAMEYRAYLVAPFLNPEFMKTCLSIPPQYKYQQNIYIQWINKFHKEVVRYKWETTGFRPRYTWQIPLSRYPKKLKSIWHRLMGSTHKLSMTPYDYWTKQNPEISLFLENLYKEKLSFLNGNQELQKDAISLFENGNLVDKILVVTLLGGIELLKIKV